MSKIIEQNSGLLGINLIKTGENIEALLRQNKMSSYKLADTLGVSQACVSKWVNGLCPPSTDHLVALKQIFNVSIDDILVI